MTGRYHYGFRADKLQIPEGGYPRLVILATPIALHSFTIESLVYCIIHPAVRESVVHSSGISMLPHTPVPPELLANMSGRVARLKPGLTTYLFPFDDGQHALTQLALTHRVPRKRDKACVIYAPAERYKLVKHTGNHLESRGFERPFWVCTPGPDDLK